MKGFRGALGRSGNRSGRVQRRHNQSPFGPVVENTSNLLNPTMKLYQFLIALVTFTLTVSVVFAQKQAESPTKRVTSSEFIIFHWGVPGYGEFPASGEWGDFADMNAMMRDLYDCGFNSNGFTDINNLRQDLKHARNNHLTGMLWLANDTMREATQEEADKTVKTLIESMTDPEDRKAVYAVIVGSEPNASEFPRLNVWSEAVRKQGFMPFVNLFPNYATPGQLGTKDYEEHLDQFIEICKPSCLCYDNYSLYDGGHLNEDQFFGNLELIRNRVLQVDIPFWNVILSNAHFHYAEPSDATLTVQVYSTLAYGGKGIGYFTFYIPPIGNYRLAPIDRFGYRTKTWEMVRNVNLQIHSLAPVYSTLKSVNVFHTGKIPSGGQGVESAQLVESVGGGESLLVGEFVDPDGKPYALVVNKNIKSSTAFSIQFKEKGQNMLISPSYKGRVPFGGEQVWLAPGNGALLTVE